jgi:hypothetical protein
MAEDQNGRIAGTTMPDVDKVREQGAANFRATLIVELATISLLIEAGMTTTEAAIQRIEQIQDALSETFWSTRCLRELRAESIYCAIRILSTLLYSGSKFDAMVSASDHSHRFGRFRIMSGSRAISELPGAAAAPHVC